MRGMRAAAVLAVKNGPVPRESNVALLLRHAERPPIPENSFGEDVRLTKAGTASAEQLGEALSARSPGVVSCSPVPRCRETADAIVRGAKWRCEVEPDKRLGDPGAFVTDAEIAGDLFMQLNKNVREIIRRQLRDPKSPAGMRSAAEGGRILLDYVGDELAIEGGQGRLNIHVTHDAILAAFMGWLFDMPAYEREHWPNFLDGVLLWRNGSQRFAMLSPEHGQVAIA